MRPHIELLPEVLGGGGQGGGHRVCTHRVLVSFQWPTAVSFAAECVLTSTAASSASASDPVGDPVDAEALDGLIISSVCTTSPAATVL